MEIIIKFKERIMSGFLKGLKMKYENLTKKQKRILLLTVILILTIVVWRILAREKVVVNNPEVKVLSENKDEVLKNDELKIEANPATIMTDLESGEVLKNDELKIEEVKKDPEKDFIVMKPNAKEVGVNIKSFGREDPYQPLIKKPVVKEVESVPISNIPILPPVPGVKNLNIPLPQEQPKPFKLSGVIFDDEPMAIIEGEGLNEIVKEGNYIRGWFVYKILRKEVILKKEKEKLILKLGE